MEPQGTETELKSPLEITNIRHLMGKAHWPDACACCLAPRAIRVDLFISFSSPPEKIPYCQVCATHPEGETKLSEVQYKQKFMMFYGHTTVWTRHSSERIPFTDTLVKIFHVSFRRAVEFDPSGTSKLRFYNVEYAKRFVNANGLDWHEIIKQNTVAGIKIDEFRGCLRALKFPAMILGIIFLLSLLLFVFSRF